MTRPQRVTIYDIAKEAGVSSGTVSRVIQEKGRVAPATRARVKNVMQSLGYQPNLAARSIRVQHTNMIGLLIPDFVNPLFATVAKAAEDVFMKAGYLLFVSSSSRSPERELRLLDHVRQRRMDGVIMSLSDERDPAVIQALNRLGAPVVLLDRDAGINADVVYSEHAEPMNRIVRHLFDLGHRRIGLITATTSIRPGRERVRGYVEAHACAGLDVDPGLVACQAQSSEYGHKEVHRMLSLPDPPTALIAGGNEILYGVQQALSLRALSVPTDISLIGSDERLVSERVSPPITVIDRDMSAVGRTAAELLLDRLLQGDAAPPKTITLPSEIVFRASIAPPCRP